ncbi:hypothetical protein DAPPUDRAFT_259668 [Daphnia pulex]|uniref:Uncharacterized protein n=1 Tax=Daphnia pulex TaxID=6669 RepID=E9HHM3_DAPPU|nr:hypothetical protein DAPPUDRAFT_259668 [Daphnia pulex]|eukprot:EFX68729.1 hypothetical protein DAPPUDRAFT_259668 [Daphnia pulex]
MPSLRFHGNKLPRIKKCNLISKHQYKKQYKELTKDKAELSNDFKSTSLLHKNFSSTLKEHDSELQSLTDISTDIAALEHEKLVADMKKLITEAIASDKSDDEKECLVTDVVNSIHMGHIRKRRRRTTEVEVIGTCGSVNSTAKWSLSFDEDSKSS